MPAIKALLRCDSAWCIYTTHLAVDQNTWKHNLISLYYTIWGIAKQQITKNSSIPVTTLRLIMGAPFYVSNHTLHSDLRISKTASTIHERFRSCLANFPNPLIRDLNSNNTPGTLPIQLAHQWCIDHINLI